ncbi:MAG: hypothetical protein KDN20_05515 [Verrucomicrobiae bacterium]|nr:hypothetical protein [Verrucomicrobiae bacterium]
MNLIPSPPIARFFTAALCAGSAILLSSGTSFAAGSSTSLSSDPFVGVAMTHDSTLNDIVREIPIISWRHKDAIAGLSAIQEQMLLHERKMRGEGLPERHRALFSQNYSTIVTAIVDDRITMCYGRELLDVHRQLLAKAYDWQRRPNPAQEYGDVIILALEELQAELGENSQSLAMVPECVRTPMVKGHQLWVEEMLQFGSHCRSLSRGELGALRLSAARLERFESYYKRDGHLTRIERQNLHERLLDLNQELIEALKL